MMTFHSRLRVEMTASGMVTLMPEVEEMWHPPPSLPECQAIVAESCIRYARRRHGR